MLECLIMGDSIAEGVSNIRKECVAYVKSGINSHNWLNTNVKNSPFEAKTVIISLGSNDLKNVDTYEELQTIRKLTNAQTVYWIIPNIKESVRKQVWMVANEYHDHVIDARNHDRSPDTIHPTYKGYKSISEQTK
jgi:lysophospholipase L1-like esterase